MGSVGDKNQVVYVDGDIPQLPLQLGQLLVDSSQIAPGAPNLQQCVSQNPLLYVPLVGGMWIDVRWFGVVGSGDEHVGIQQAVNAASAAGGGYVYFPTGSYSTGTTTLTVPDSVILLGQTAENTFITYAGTSFAIIFQGGNNGIDSMYVKVSDVAGEGIQWGNDSRRQLLRRTTIQNVATPAASRTGRGISLTTTGAATAFSGDMMMEQAYVLGFKYGLHMDCATLIEKTWTSVVANQLFIVGAGLNSGTGHAIITGSRNIFMSATTDGVGTSIFGGTLEGSEVPIEVANGGFGLNYYGDIEGNEFDAPILGVSWCGEIVVHPAGIVYRGGAQSTTARWFLERSLSGVWTREAFAGHQYVLYNNGGSANFFDVYRGDSLIAGGSPTLKFRIATGNSNADAAGERNYLQLNGHAMTWTAGAPPASGTWAQGDVANNASAAVGSPKSWLCTVAGTPGTWVSTGNL